MVVCVRLKLRGGHWPIYLCVFIPYYVNHHPVSFWGFPSWKDYITANSSCRQRALRDCWERTSCAHVTYTCSDLALLTMLFVLDFDNNFFEESVTNSVQITMALVIQ